MHQTRYTIRLICLIGILGTLLFSSCGTRAPRYDYRELAQAAIRLDMDIAMEDNHRLYIESSRWIGVPYRTGGNTMRGVDCSGLTYNIYKKVYHKHLKRNSDDQRKENCRKVGIYLKDNRFIHASTSRGVIVSRLDEPYYRRVWMQGGRVKGL